MHVLQHGTSAQKETITESLKQGTLQYLPEILEAVAATNAIDYTRSVAAQEIDLALSALQILPDSVYKKALAEIAEYAIKRDH